MDVGSDYYEAARRLSYPAFLPPISCSAPEHAAFLRAHWAYALGIHPVQVPLVPLTDPSRPTAPGVADWTGLDMPQAKTGGFKVALFALPLERINVADTRGERHGQLADIACYA